jgi:uncharacterized protein (DUF2141 family)
MRCIRAIGVCAVAIALGSGVARAQASPAVAPPAVSAQPSPAAEDGRIEAAATNLRNSKGSFRCEIFNNAKGFPRTDESVVGHAVVKIRKRQAACVFRNLQPGDYAVVAMHDENDNGKMDYNFLGIPIEGYGFSSGARALFGPPSFDAAKFTYRGGVMRVPIELKY